MLKAIGIVSLIVVSVFTGMIIEREIYLWSLLPINVEDYCEQRCLAIEYKVSGQGNFNERDMAGVDMFNRYHKRKAYIKDGNDE